MVLLGSLISLDSWIYDSANQVTCKISVTLTTYLLLITHAIFQALHSVTFAYARQACPSVSLCSHLTAIPNQRSPVLPSSTSFALSGASSAHQTCSSSPLLCCLFQTFSSAAPALMPLHSPSSSISDTSINPQVLFHSSALWFSLLIFWGGSYLSKIPLTTS